MQKQVLVVTEATVAADDTGKGSVISWLSDFEEAVVGGGGVGDSDSDDFMKTKKINQQTCQIND